MEHAARTHPPQASRRLQLGSRLVLCVFLAIVGFYLITEHTAHLFGVLPYLLLLLCPLMHLLHGGHHRGHGHHRSTASRTEGEQE